MASPRPLLLVSSAVLSCVLALTGCGDDDTSPPPGGDAGPMTDTDAGPMMMGTDAGPGGAGPDVLLTGPCTNVSGTFQVRVDGEVYGPFALLLSPRDPAAQNDWDLIGCDPAQNFGASIHFVLPAGMSVPTAGPVTLPNEVAAIDPVAEGFFSGNITATEMPAAWPLRMLGFMPAFMGGRDAEMEITTFSDTALVGSLFTPASRGTEIEIDFNLSID